MVRRPKYLQPARDGQRWLISYTDVLTLLLILFIAVAAQMVAKSEASGPVSSHTIVSPVIPAKAAIAPVAVKPVAVTPAANPSNSQSREALLRLEQSLKQHGLDAKREERG